MATQPSMTIAKKRHTQERAQEESQVHSHSKPLPKTVIRNGLALVQIEERVIVRRRAALRVIPTATDVNQSRGILAHRAIAMYDCRSE